MASTDCPNRRTPVARFNTFEEPDDQIKAQIGHASHTQRALKARALCAPKPSNQLETVGVPPARLHRNSKSFNCAARSDWVSPSLDPEPHPLDRTPSFNSLSTLHREAEIARLSQWRDSPVSAYMPSDRAATFATDKAELEVPCPPISVYTLRQARKDRREEKRSVKKKEREQKRAGKVAAHKRRASEVQVTSADPLCATNGDIPQRAASDPSAFKSSKNTAIQLVKLAATKSVSRLTRRRSKNQDLPSPMAPHVDDFDSKPDLQEYLNSSLPESTTSIAELPGPLPPYTPFQNATRNIDNAPLPATAAEMVSGVLVTRSPSDRTPGLETPTASRMMRCDLCQFGIKVDDQFFHCSICNSGDRIVCSACDASGLSCRHELTERVRKVLRYDDGARQPSTSRHGSRRHQAAPPTSDDMPRHTPSNASMPHLEIQSPPALHLNAINELREKQFSFELKELAVRRREQDVSFREREMGLKEREARLRIREAEADAQIRQQDANTRILVSQLAEMASLGAQFARSQSQKSAVSSSDEDILADADNEGVRYHAAKRKGGASRSGTGTGRLSVSPRKGDLRKASARSEQSGNEEDEEEENGSGTPKKPRLDLDVSSGDKLYACHFCKYNSQRYSERNHSEKQYRGCSSGYWPDISRLKQHLYRVHWRGLHCRRCYTVFKKQEDLDAHTGQLSRCTIRDNPFPEKFGDDEYNEIKRKRPAASAEDVWYVIYEILFPCDPRPASPFAESTSADAVPTSAPSTPSSAQRNLHAVQQMFEARLDQYREMPWLQAPGAREFIMEQLRGSMADVIRSMEPLTVNTPATGGTSAERSPASVAASRRSSRPSLHVQSTFSHSFATSPDPGSATSTHSASSGQWLLPSHRLSFSRPLPARTESIHEPTLISATETTPSEIIFRVPTPVDPENDHYDGESHSWHKGDEGPGVAITTEDFDFHFGDLLPTQSPPVMSCVRPEQVCSPAPRLMSAPTFKPVKVASLADHPSAEAKVETYLHPNISNASADSGYESMPSRPSSSVTHTRTCTHPKSVLPVSNIDVATPDLGSDTGVNLDALVSYEEFLGAKMDEFGNVNGRSLTDYVYRDSQ